MKLLLPLLGLLLNLCAGVKSPLICTHLSWHDTDFQISVLVLLKAAPSDQALGTFQILHTRLWLTEEAYLMLLSPTMCFISQDTITLCW